MKSLKHIPDVLNRFIEGPPEKRAYNLWKDGKWTFFSKEDVVVRVNCLAASLHELGLKKGQRVGILAKTSPNWSIIDFAIVLAGGVTVPFFSNLSQEHFFFEANQSSPKWLFFGDHEEYRLAASCSHLFEGMFCIEEGVEDRSFLSLEHLIRKGATILREKPGLIRELENSIKPDDLATIIYTSGSTGDPKGVELTHKNLVSIIHFDDFALRRTDKYLSILPLAHIFAKQIHLIATAWGVPIYFLNDLKKISLVCQEVPITRMILVPRVLEKVYAKITDSIKSAKFLRRIIGIWALDLAHREKGVYKTLMLPVANKLVFSKIRKKFGENFHSILSGGAPLSPRLHHFFLTIGIPIYQGWGLTEGSCIAVNRLFHNKIGTVGPPVESIQLKISEKGEVLAKGPTIMKGYYKNPEATKKAIDKDGWLHTGDRGLIDQDGHLVIQGRINESFKTSQGEFVDPVAIEQKICEHSLVDMAMVVGDALPFASVLLYLDPEEVDKFKKRKKMQHIDNALLDEMQKMLDKINSKLDQWQKIKCFKILEDQPSIEGGEITPTLKLRRKAIMEKYQGVIDEMYEITPKKEEKKGASDPGISQDAESKETYETVKK